MAQYGMPTLSPLASRAKERKSPAKAASSPVPTTPAARLSAVAAKGTQHGTTLDQAVHGQAPSKANQSDTSADEQQLPALEPDRPDNNLSSDSDGIVAIDVHGDLVLHIEHQTTAAKLAQKYRVSTAALKANSRYFVSLLDGRFGESVRAEQQRTSLRQQYEDLSKAPSSELPTIHIKDIGRISAVKLIDALCTDFLLILHGRDTLASPPVSNLANIAIVADRFDALEIVRAHARRKRLIRAIDGKTTQKADLGLTEERVRQRLLIGALLDYAPWMDKYSARIITKGWVEREVEDTDALWWSLPLGLEEELISRREYILDMLQSSIAQFVGFYMSRERQCRLGYDSSAACDSFQLGEMIRFLSRTGILQVKGMLFDAGEPLEPYEGDIMTLVDCLRQVPEYQIDRNHSHCGIRGRLISLLDIVTDALHHTGICAECWAAARHEHAWRDAKQPLLWKSQAYRSRGLGHKELHAQVIAVFTATDRDWK